MDGLSQLFRMDLYRKVEMKRAAIMEEIAGIPDRMGMPAEYRGKIGLLGGSGCHGYLINEVSAAIAKGARSSVKVEDLTRELRRLVKSHYGDEYDAVGLSTCEAGLQTAFDALMSPPIIGRGDNYRARYIAPKERHMHHQGGYGRPFPPKYKDIAADRGVTAGEMGIAGKRLTNLEVVYVPMEGARYEAHGIKYYECPLLLDVDPAATAQKLAAAAATHGAYLSGFASMGYDTPGYGCKKDAQGVPMLHKAIGDLAKQYNVPYLVDNARGIPFHGISPAEIGADVMVYSTDKAFNGPTGGLMIGTEEAVIQVMRALGMHSQRWGTTIAHGKAGYVGFDPGKEMMLGLVRVLEILLNEPKRFTDPVDQLFAIVKEEFAQIDSPVLQKGLQISKSYNCMTVEVNYQRTWEHGGLGIPIFTIEDMYAGSNLIQSAMGAMQMIPGMLAYDANMVMAAGLGTTDENGELIEDAARYAVRGVAQALEVIAKHSTHELLRV